MTEGDKCCENKKRDSRVGGLEVLECVWGGWEDVALKRVVRGSLFRRQDLNKDLKMADWLCWQLGRENSK